MTALLGSHLATGAGMVMKGSSAHWIMKAHTIVTNAHTISWKLIKTVLMTIPWHPLGSWSCHGHVIMKTYTVRHTDLSQPFKWLHSLAAIWQLGLAWSWKGLQPIESWKHIPLNHESTYHNHESTYHNMKTYQNRFNDYTPWHPLGNWSCHGHERVFNSLNPESWKRIPYHENLIRPI